MNKATVNFFCRLTDRADARRSAKQKPVEGTEEYKDIFYTEAKDPYRALDVYRAQTKEVLPVVVDFHGGAWVYGDKSINERYCKTLAKRGFAVVNANYRLIKEGCGGGFPETLNDIYDVFSWVAKNIADYGGDKERVFLTGDSAGAHLACLAALLKNRSLHPTLPQDEKNPVFVTELDFSAIALTCGVSDLEVFRKKRIPLVNYMFGLFVGEGGRKSPFAEYLSLQNHPLENLPPVFLSTSDKDFMRHDVKKFAKLLSEKTETELFYDEKGVSGKLIHVYNVLYPEWPESEKVIDATAEFFLKHVKNKDNRTFSGENASVNGGKEQRDGDN